MKTSKIEPLKSCPFCNSHDVITNSTGDVSWENCQKCGAGGPTYKKRGTQEVIGWNTRLGVVNSDSELLNFLDRWMKKHAAGAGWVFHLSANPSESTGLVATFGRKAKKAREALVEAIKNHKL